MSDEATEKTPWRCRICGNGTYHGCGRVGVHSVFTCKSCSAVFTDAAKFCAPPALPKGRGLIDHVILTGDPADIYRRAEEQRLRDKLAAAEENLIEFRDERQEQEALLEREVQSLRALLGKEGGE